MNEKMLEKDREEAQLIKTLAKYYLEDDLKLSQIGEKYGWSKQRIQQLLKKGGYSYKDKVNSKFSKERLEDLYVGKKLSPKEIGEILGVNQNTVVKYLKDAEIKIRKARKNPALTKEVLEDLWVNKGLSQTKIGKEWGYVQSAVANLLKLEGITRPEA